MTGLLVLLAVLLGASAFGVYRRRVDGQLRQVSRERPDEPTEIPALVEGSVAVVDEVSGMIPGVAHVEIDAEAHLDLVRRLDIRRTPTVLILDAAGDVRVRAAGAPRKADVIAALGTLM